ncbi:hypothetical protein TSOC_009943 [Tetrabaena socialis]|uniref:Dirigent protein n=1 Tax=Tetrabaena socialis TaxID=47790 RepID=A0A2J7ZUK7_9CHLO|nr:hypothetical protein TSOC_009943 [Tetrabaena socialis]|eukprot:PNH03956.1 hypothetical protein TSOC_009943 [Tetrabaena socialis]
MSRTSMQLFAVAALAALATAVAQLGSGVGSSGQPPAELCARTITVVETFSAAGLQVPMGINATDYSTWPGSTVGYNNDLVFGGSGMSNRTAGGILSMCFVQSASGDASYSYCIATATFSMGSITFQGPFPDDVDSVFVSAVVGGTGIFNGATGSAKVTVLTAGTQWKYKFTLMSKPACM